MKRAKRFFNLVNRNHRKWKALSRHRDVVQRWIISTIEGKVIVSASICPLARRVDDALTSGGKSCQRKQQTEIKKQQVEEQQKSKEIKKQQNEKPRQQEKQHQKKQQNRQQEMQKHQQVMQHDDKQKQQQNDLKQKSKQGKQQKTNEYNDKPQQQQDTQQNGGITTMKLETTENGNISDTPAKRNNSKEKQKSKRKSKKSESEKMKPKEPQVQPHPVDLTVDELHIVVSPNNDATVATGAVTPHMFVTLSEGGTAKKYAFDLIKPLPSRSRVIRRRPGLGLLPRDIEYCLHMMETYGDNYDAMVADERNVYMDDASAFARKIRIFRDSAHYRDYVASRSATPQPQPLQQQYLVT